MAETENFRSFFKESKKLVKEYLDTKLELYRLKCIRLFSRLTSHLIWIIICVLLLWLLIIFLALVAGFWLSGMIGSYTLGFGITSLAIGLLIIIIVFLLKKFVMNQILRTIIRLAMEETKTKMKEDGP